MLKKNIQNKDKFHLKMFILSALRVVKIPKVTFFVSPYSGVNIFSVLYYKT